MDTEKNELDELTREIKKVIAGNRKFLKRVMDEDFEPEEGEIGEGEEAGEMVEL
ncbi:MAG TPA: hypothetical protein VMJ66_06390 [Geobacteraceae bacterium]|nr:hypothetical protein [Geobacteraceae bacterium]